MKLQQLLQDYSIKYAGPGQKHYRAGWINLPCPFCTGHLGNHLGYNLTKNYWKCWRCGHKKNIQVIQKLLNLNYREAQQLIRKYQGTVVSKKISEKVKMKRLKFKFPTNTLSLNKVKGAMNYFESRNFSKIDYYKLIKKYDLKATIDLAFLNYSGKELDLSYRIIAPITFQDEIVSWQSRDYSGKAFLRYITCPEILEKIKHKTILYNAPDYRKYSTIVLCEGIFDVWKVYLSGFPATCCFGVEYTYSQFKLLKKYKKVLIFLDQDIAGKTHTKKLFNQLIFAGTDAELIKYQIDQQNFDPGEMSKKQIKKILLPYF